MSALRRRRVDKHLSIEQLAAVADLSPEQIRNIENGRTRNPRASTLTKLANALDCSPSQIDPILTDVPDPEPKAAA